MSSKNYVPAMMFRATAVYMTYTRAQAVAMLEFLDNRVQDGCNYCSQLRDAILIQATNLGEDCVAIAAPHVGRLKYYGKYLKKAEKPVPAGMEEFLDIVGNAVGIATGKDVFEARVHNIRTGEKP